MSPGQRPAPSAQRLLGFDLVLGGVPRFPSEAAWARRLITRYARLLPGQTTTTAWGRRPLVAEAAGDSPLVLVQADPESYLLPRAARRLLSAAASPEWDVALPVSNEPWSEQARCAPPFPYQTPSLLAETVAHVAESGGKPRATADPRSPVFAVKRQALESLPAGLALDEAPLEAARRGKAVAIDPGAYLHRYGDLDNQTREDLALLLPAGARAVLDVGCSRGATAAVFRDRAAVRIVGIEPDREAAAGAARLYDRVLPVPLEEVAEEFPGEFDAILFGDVLEHLTDPSAALVRVRPWLSARGVLVASVPNLGHWSIVADLLEGRFDYVPYSILSGTHLRFFTRRTLCDLFEACGYAVERIESVRFPVSPDGAARLARLAALPGASEDLSVAEFLVVAKPAPAGRGGSALLSSLP